MGKKRTRKTVTSKGQRRSIVAGVKEVRQEKSEGEKAYNKLKSWRKGQNPWITVAGPQTNKRFIKVRANTVYGDPKRASYGIYTKPSTND
jgi:hypothetical protein